MRSETVKSLKRENRALVIVTGVTFCLIILGVYTSNIFSFFALVLAASMLFYLPEDDFIAYLMFLMPFANIFKNAPESQSFFTYLILGYVLYTILIKGKLNKQFLLIYGVLVAYAIVQMFWSINILRSIKFVANIFLTYNVLRVDAKQEGKNIYLMYIAGIIVSSLLSILNTSPRLIEYVSEKTLPGDSLTVRFAGLYGDPNYYSINVLICLCLVVILNHKKFLGMVSSVALSIALVAFALMTFSKSAFIMLVFSAFMLIYSKVKTRKYLVALTVLLLGVTVAFYVLDGQFGFLEIILSRFFEAEDINSLTTGRLDLWNNYINYFQSSFLAVLFGEGFGAKPINGMYAHNTYIDMIYYLGIFGTFLLIYVLAVAFKGKTKNKKNLLNYSILMIVLIMYFFLSELFYFDCPFHLIIAGQVYRTGFETITKSQ